MTDRPILFSAPMVRALLAGTKTQTRRTMPDQCLWRDDSTVWTGFMGWQAVEWAFANRGAVGKGVMPRFEIGDRLWVKETHAYVGTCDPGFLIYRATYDECCAKHGFDHTPAQSEVTWKPSIFMRRALSRITLTVTDVRVERLQDISEADAIAEGWPVGLVFPVDWYRDLWDSINGKGAWAQNPWVVAVSFDVREGNIDA